MNTPFFFHKYTSCNNYSTMIEETLKNFVPFSLIFTAFGINNIPNKK